MAEQSQINFLWKQIREKAEEIIPPVSFNAFIKDLEPVDVINRRIYLKASSDLAANTIMKRQAAPLRDAISRCDLGISDFRLVVDGSDVYNFETEEDFGEDFKPVPINKNFTFDSFVVGSSNKFVYAAAKSVAEHPGESFNPLFIYGESGLGKTHLMQAIANYVEKNNPGKRVLYTTCDNFLNEFIDSMISGKISSRDKGTRFRLHYRNVDILMIDDIHSEIARAKKPGVQEEFFHTFNELSSQNKQIVLTSDRPPKEIATLEERLRTRFEGGLIADIPASRSRDENRHLEAQGARTQVPHARRCPGISRGQFGARRAYPRRAADQSAFREQTARRAHLSRSRPPRPCRIGERNRELGRNHPPKILYPPSAVIINSAGKICSERARKPIW